MGISISVVKAIGLPSVLSGKSPNVYVKIKIDDFSVRTNIEKRSNDPVWNKEFQMCVMRWACLFYFISFLRIMMHI
jgi:Ca2+-dependent lipid-binding protein